MKKSVKKQKKLFSVKWLIVLSVLAILIVIAAAVKIYSRPNLAVEPSFIPGSGTRIYRQTKDVAAYQTGRVRSSARKGDLFEMTYQIDIERGTVTRSNIRRLDKKEAVADDTAYRIVNRRYLLKSRAGEGGGTIIAVHRNSGEILSLGDTFAFSTRTSDFAQMITGVYDRVY